MNANNTPMHDLPQYMHGQLLGLRALIAALASVTTTPEEFQEAGQAALEQVRTALLPEPVSEAQLNGLAEVERWLAAPKS